jgi:PIN domain nuclease of toxin-antitoxin system
MQAKYRKYIFDASALICLFAKEEGFEEVKKYLPNAIISAVNISEVYKYCIEKQELDLESVEKLINLSGVEVIDFNHKNAIRAAVMYKDTKKYGLSFADRSCIALSMTTSYPIVTCDRVWSALELDIKIIQVR